ncbi:MAG: TatD family hydrolase [Lachnospiraceae bacterium]|nr:TatD family hydrolase [Lachnospiraceae bacterium]
MSFEKTYITDTHAHYDDDAFNDDREELLLSLREAGIGKVINVGASMDGCYDSYDLCKKYPFIFCALGVHPSECGELTGEDMEWIRQKTSDEKVVAIGEIGLDYHFDDDPAPEIQQKWFKEQLILAGQTGLPVIIHSRDAAADTLRVLSENHAEDIGGVMHCYSYSKEMASQFLEMGLYFGIGGVITFKNGRKLREVVEYIPVEKILLETDCPYLAPEPYRGKRNCSLYLPGVAEAVAAIKGMTTEELISVTTQNAHRLFGLGEI